jgi:hypothetical protein
MLDRAEIAKDLQRNAHDFQEWLNESDPRTRGLGMRDSRGHGSERGGQKVRHDAVAAEMCPRCPSRPTA